MLCSAFYFLGLGPFYYGDQFDTAAKVIPDDCIDLNDGLSHLVVIGHLVVGHLFWPHRPAS